MDLKPPFFMTNKEWYYHDPKEWRLKLTDKAPPEAVKSYEEYYRLIDEEGIV
jgi:hypothetical protein